MQRAILVATGTLENLPREIQTVANELSESGWQVRLCLAADASVTGLLQAAGEGDCQLAWFGLHSSAAGFELADGVWPATQMGVWLRNVNARDVVLNSCYSLEHVGTIQRAADVDVAASIDPAGVDDGLAWQVGVYLVRSYIISNDLSMAVRQASGFGSVQYRFLPCGGVRLGGRGRMPGDRIEEQLKELLDAVKGKPEWRQSGLLTRFDELSTALTAISNEQSAARREMERMVQEQRTWRADIDRRLAIMEQDRYIQVSPRLMTMGIAFGAITAILLLFLLLRLGGAF